MAEINDFDEVRFPTDIAFGSSGGPERSTRIISLGSGHEHRNQRWARSRRRYDAGYGVKDLNALYAVIDFFEARRGPMTGFRFRDPMDWKSCPPLKTPQKDDQILGTGDGTTTIFQIVKKYGDGPSSYIRSIGKPVAGSLIVAVNGSVRQEGTDFALNVHTGQLEFSPSAVPAAGAVISAGYEFDVPVRFASDQLTVNIAAFTAGDVPSVPLVEILP